MKVPIYLIKGKEYQHLVNINLFENSTIGYIKETIKKAFDDKYQIIDFFVNSEESLNIFQNNKFNNYNLESVWRKIKNPFIVVVSLKNIKELPVDVLRKIGLDLSTRDLLSFCSTNKNFNEKICKDENFWRNKVFIDYPKQLENKLYDFKKFNQKNLYMLFTMPSKIIELDTEKHPELQENFINDRIPSPNEETVPVLMTKVLYKNPPKEILKRGDVIMLDWAGYRNDGKFFWDGEKVIELDYDSGDDYGSVPFELSFPEFPPDYFLKSIEHNNIIRITDDKIKEIIDNTNIESKTSFVSDKYNTYKVKLKDVNYKDYKTPSIYGNIFEYDKYDKTISSLL